MARSRKVEASVAESKALEAFWEVGYERLGVRELESRTGINRFLLNTAYGGKIQLFLKLVDQYTKLAYEVMFAAVNAGGVEEIAQSFEQRVTPNGMPPAAAFGCLVTNTSTEFANTEAGVHDRIEAYFTMVRNSFRQALVNAKADKTVDAEFDVDEKAEWLLTTALGLNVRIRAEGISDGVIMSANETARMVRAWKVQ